MVGRVTPNSAAIWTTVWDGGAGEKGGTVVELARTRDVPVDVVWPEGAARKQG